MVQSMIQDYNEVYSPGISAIACLTTLSFVVGWLASDVEKYRW